jgi:hypothetical protein
MEVAKWHHSAYSLLEAGSFGRAAGILGLTQPVVSRALGRLEAGIGIRLLERTTRAVGPRKKDGSSMTELLTRSTK